MIKVNNLALIPFRPLEFTVKEGEILALKTTLETKELLLLNLSGVLSINNATIETDTPLLVFSAKSIPSELYVKEFIHLVARKSKIKLSLFWINLLEIVKKYDDRDLLFNKKILKLSEKERARLITYSIFASDLPNIVLPDLDYFDNIHKEQIKKDLKNILNNGTSILIFADYLNLGESIEYDLV